MRRARFGRQVRGILKTPPLRLSDSGGAHVVTQLQSKDVLLYLAAIKSFARHVPLGKVHVLDDGSLDADDRAVISAHVPGASVAPITMFREPSLPAGGTWERLTAIAHLSNDDYVIQLDADTLTLGPVPEVTEAVRTGRSFTIGTWNGQELEPMHERAREAGEIWRNGGRHVQIEAEAIFGQLSDSDSLRYVRGCSGFAGFAPSAERLDFMRDLSPRIERLVGAAWREWGSEQVMSNILVANSSEAIVLPHPTYCDCTKIMPEQTRFIHFIGCCRFIDGRYADMINRLGL